MGGLTPAAVWGSPGSASAYCPNSVAFRPPIPLPAPPLPPCPRLSATPYVCVDHRVTRVGDLSPAENQRLLSAGLTRWFLDEAAVGGHFSAECETDADVWAELRLEMTHQGCTIPAARPALMCRRCGGGQLWTCECKKQATHVLPQVAAGRFEGSSGVKLKNVFREKTKVLVWFANNVHLSLH